MVTVLNMFLEIAVFLKVQSRGRSFFSIFINDLKAVNTNKNLLVKIADGITVTLPTEANVGLDESETEVLSFIEWSENNCIKVHPNVYPNILKAFENKRYDRIWKGPFNREVSYYFLRPMRKHLTGSPYITAKKQRIWSAKQTPLCTWSTLFCNVTARKFPTFNFHGGRKKKLIIFFSIFSWTWVLYCKFRKIHLHFSKFSYEMI